MSGLATLLKVFFNRECVKFALVKAVYKMPSELVLWKLDLWWIDILLPLSHPSQLVSAALFLVWGHHSQTLSHHHLVSWYDSSCSCSGWSHRHHLAQSWSNCTLFVASPLGCCDSVEQTSQHGTSTTALVGSSWKCSSITARRHFPATCRSAMANL